MNMNEKKRKNLENRLGELQELIDSFKFDIDNIGQSIATTSKIMKGEEVTEEEKLNLALLKDERPSFFESEDESGEENEEGEKRLNRVQRVLEAKEYLERELEAANNESNLIQKELEKPNISEGGASIEAPLGEITESSRKRRAVSSDEEEESSLKKPRKEGESGSPSDFIDDLPSDHNPFDDIGTD